MNLRAKIVGFEKTILGHERKQDRTFRYEKGVDAVFHQRTEKPWSMKAIAANGERDPEEILNCTFSAEIL